MDKKLPDSEIIKALESYIKDITCAKCGFKDNYLLIVIKNALDLINRQKARVEKCEKVEHFADKTIATLQAENERLKNILICFMGALGKVRNIDDIESISQIPIMTELNKGIRAEIKAEAYKEFANELKCRTHEISYNTLQGVTEYDINNLLKELVGEDNGEEKE